MVGEPESPLPFVADGPSLPGRQLPAGEVAADLNGDGHMEFAVVNQQSLNLVVYFKRWEVTGHSVVFYFSPSAGVPGQASVVAPRLSGRRRPLHIASAPR